MHPSRRSVSSIIFWRSNSAHHCRLLCAAMKLEELTRAPAPSSAAHPRASAEEARELRTRYRSQPGFRSPLSLPSRLRGGSSSVAAAPGSCRARPQPVQAAHRGSPPRCSAGCAGASVVPFRASARNRRCSRRPLDVALAGVNVEDSTLERVARRDADAPGRPCTDRRSLRAQQRVDLRLARGVATRRFSAVARMRVVVQVHSGKCDRARRSR